MKQAAIATVCLTAFFLITLIPTIWTVTHALWASGGTSHLLLDARATGLLGKSLALGCGVSVCALAIGVPVGFLISRTDIYFRRLAHDLALLPLAIPPYVAAIAWMKLVGLSGLGSVIWILSLAYFPFVSLLTAAGLVSVDRALEEQAEVAVGKAEAIRRITLPLAAPFMLAGGLFVFVFAMANYGVPSLLQVQTYPIEIFTQYAAFYDHQQAGLRALPLLGMTALLVAVSSAIMRGRSYVSLRGAAPELIPLKGTRLPGSAFVWLVIALSSVLPIGVLVAGSGSVTAYRMVLQTSLSAIGMSLAVASLSALACLVLGGSVAYLIERTQWRGRTVVDLVSVLPLAIPGTVLGISLIEFWNRPLTGAIYGSVAVMIIGLTARHAPFAVRIMSSNLKQVDRRLEEAAALTGTACLTRAHRILLPLLRPGVLASVSLCFLFGMAEIDTTLLVMPPGSETLASKIYTLMHYDLGPFTMAACVLLIAFSIAPVMLLGSLVRGRPQ